MHKTFIKNILITILLFYFAPVKAQYLVPFLGEDGLYGFANPNGKVLTAPQFTRAWTTDSLGLTFAMNDQKVLYLINPDGTIMPNSIFFHALGPQLPKYRVLNNLNDYYLIDTLPDKYCLRSADQQYYILLLKGKKGWESRLYYHGSVLGYKGPLILGNLVENNATFNFYKGYQRVIKASRKVNIVNTNLEEIFPQDYANGGVLNEKFIALADTSGRYALANTKGKVLTAFRYAKLTVSINDNVVAVTPSGRAGLLRSDGSVALDTIYRSLQPVTDQWIIAQKQDGFGLIDFKGNELLPLKYTSLSYAHDNKFIAGTDNWSGYTVIDETGTPVLEKAWPSIEYFRFGQPFYLFSDKKATPEMVVLDSLLRPVYRDTLTGVVQRNQFFNLTNAKGAHGVISYTGQVIVPVEYREIINLPEDAGFLVEKDSLFGCYAPDGRVILPCRFRKIVPEKTASGMILWANPYRDKYLFAGYTLDGQKLPGKEVISPTLRAVSLKNCIAPEMENGQWKVVMPDGSWIYKPREYPYKNINVKAPDGCLMVEKEGGMCRILDAFFKPIIPAGFNLPEARYRGPFLQMGLTPVYKDDLSGIIDTKGNWVRQPDKFKYHIFRRDMYAAYKKEPTPQDPEGITIYILDPKGTRTVEVHMTDDKFVNGYLRVGRLFDGPKELVNQQGFAGKIFKFALMDTLGNLVTPFMLKTFGINPGKAQAAQIYTDDFTVKNVVLDAAGKVIRDFGDRHITDYDAERQWYYFLDEKNQTYIVDSVGNEVLPGHYGGLQWKIPGALFTTNEANSKVNLYHKNGNLLLSGLQYVSDCQKSPDGYFIVAGDKRIYVLSPQLTVVCSVAGNAFGFDPDHPDLLRVETPDRKLAFVHYRKGIIFQAKQ